MELEVMGIKCPKADKVPDDWYFMRHGKKVYDRSRYQLDFRNPEVIAHATEVIDRLVNDKMALDILRWITTLNRELVQN